MSVWSRQHYNAIAKEIREQFPTDNGDELYSLQFFEGGRSYLTSLAVNFAKRFVEDNERFDPIQFLDACSPNTDLYLLSELWKNE